MDPTTLDVAWTAHEPVSSEDIKEARLRAHWAAQVVATIGSSLLEPQADYGHTALTWHDGLGAVASRPVLGARPYRAALQISTLRLMLLDDGDAVVASYDLPGHTLDEAIAWLAEAIEAYSHAPSKPLTRVAYTIEAHPVQAGAPFGAPTPALQELERWFRNGARLLEAVRATTTGAGEVRVWPHHFDVATLVSLDDNPADPEHARSLGFGMSPGDETYPSPYWYLLPWPKPAPERLVALDVGDWHREGFVAAVLTEPSDVATVVRFFRSADRAARNAIGGPAPTGK